MPIAKGNCAFRRFGTLFAFFRVSELRIVFKDIVVSRHGLVELTFALKIERKIVD